MLDWTGGTYQVGSCSSWDIQQGTVFMRGVRAKAQYICADKAQFICAVLQSVSYVTAEREITSCHFGRSLPSPRSSIYKGLDPLTGDYLMWLSLQKITCALSEQVCFSPIYCISVLQLKQICRAIEISLTMIYYEQGSIFQFWGSISCFFSSQNA